jgi:subtilisin family serine protease
MLLALVTAAALLGASAHVALAAQPHGVLVRFAKTADAGDRADARGDAGTKLDEVLPLRGLQLVKPEPGVTSSEAIRALERSPDVLYAEPDRVRKASALPNDHFFSGEWGMNNTGQNANGTIGTADADIDAPEAWNVTTGSSAVTVGILDTGVDATHPDLSSNIWTNPGEIPANGQDDDGNGLVDDVHGWDWVSNDSDPTDEAGHGTHVSGTVGGRGDNFLGVAGVAWNVSLVPLRVLDSTGSGSVSNLIKGYNYARQKGLRVANASLGSGGYSQTEHDAIAAASNTLFLVAAGNGDSNQVGLDNDAPGNATYPCNYDLPNLICVAATDSHDALTSFSDYGTTSVDLAAPGQDIISSWASSQCGSITPPCWAWDDGTSMATPHVAGTAALVLAEHPTYSVAQLRQALLGSVDPKPSLAGKLVTGGRLNAFAAVAGAAPSGSGGSPSGAGGGGGPLVQAPSPTSALTVDRSAPSIRLTIRRLTMLAALRRGVRVKVRSSEAARLRFDLLVGSATRAGARVRASRRLLVGRARDSLSKAGSITRSVGLSRRARRALRGLHGVRLRLRVRAVDRKGNARTVSRLVVLR